MTVPDYGRSLLAGENIILSIFVYNLIDRAFEGGPWFVTIKVIL
jgi:hypothetical protein